MNHTSIYGFAVRAANGTADSPASKVDADVPPRVSTSDKIYDDSEAEFLAAVTSYKASTGRKFLSCSEYLHVARGLGYVKPDGPA